MSLLRLRSYAARLYKAHARLSGLLSLLSPDSLRLQDCYVVTALTTCRQEASFCKVACCLESALAGSRFE